MRLTLRTLLAYLDDILDPADKEQLAKKIESSEFAEDLVHRTRDTMRRLRLSAPQVIGSGMGLDPNTVAEYLDNVLPPESVGDFERICLESDMHLAEAAACHHVLTMVLGEPADVDAVARQRMYTIQSENDARRRLRVEAAHSGTGGMTAGAAPTQAVAAPPAGAVAQATAPPQVPDYLRTSAWGGYRALLLGLAAVVLIAAGVFFVPGLRGWFGGATAEKQLAAGTTADVPAGVDTATLAPPIQASETAQADFVPSGAAAPGAVDAAGSDRYPFATTEAPNGRANVPPSEAVHEAQAAADGTPTSGTPMASSDAPDVSPDATAPEPSTTGVPLEPGVIPPPIASISPAPLPAVPSAESEAPPAAAIAAADATAPAAAARGAGNVPLTAGPDRSAPPRETPDAPVGPAELGTYLGRKTVLLRYDENSGRWFRMEPRTAVVAGERLLALPQFRPKLLLAEGLNVDLSGGTQVIVGTAEDEAVGGLPAADAGTPLVEVVYGRIILINTANEASQLRLKLGPAVGEARLARNATLGVEVVRQHVPGLDPRQTPGTVTAHLYAPDGGVQWLDAAGPKTAGDAARWTISEGTTTEIAADPSPPDWIDHEPIGQLSEQRYAAPKIESTLVSDRPADMQLLELFQTVEQREDKSLVAKCSIHVGVFEPFIEALRDSDQRPNWQAHIEMLRSAMALSPELAANVKQALVEQRGRPAADDLYEMLCGYTADQIGRTPEQMKSGAVARLIDRLENDSLDYRVLAVHDLLEITGKRLMPDPAANLNERTQNVRRWRTRLQDGDLMPVKR